MQRLPAVTVLLLALIPWPARAPAQAVASRALAPGKAAAVDEAVQAVIAKQHLIGVAIGVIQEGRVVYLKGYGLADREGGKPVTTETIFSWASNSKPLAAVLALQLVEKGELNLGVDVRRYVPEFPDKGTAITCRQLLCHQSGLPHYSNGKVVPAERGDRTPPSRPDPIASLDRFSQSPLLFTPGSKSEYSSYGYILLSAAIQRAGKRDFDDQVRIRIAKPLVMGSLQPDRGEAGPLWAAGYTKKGDQIVRAREEANDWKFGAGGYKSDIRDFARWAEALLNHRLLSARSEQTLWTQQSTTGGEATGFGLGFHVEDGRQGFKVSHNGKQAETTTRLVLYPKARHGVVVMCNCGFADVGAISTAIYSALSRKP